MWGTLVERRQWTAAGINVLLLVGLPEAARELEGVLCDIDAQLHGVIFSRESNGKKSQRPALQPVQ
jgi:hypothetical protein